MVGVNRIEVCNGLAGTTDAYFRVSSEPSFVSAAGHIHNSWRFLLVGFPDFSVILGVQF